MSGVHPNSPVNNATGPGWCVKKSRRFAIAKHVPGLLGNWDLFLLPRLKVFIHIHLIYMPFSLSSFLWFHIPVCTSELWAVLSGFWFMSEEDKRFVLYNFNLTFKRSVLVSFLKIRRNSELNTRVLFLKKQVAICSCWDFRVTPWVVHFLKLRNT